MTYYRKSVLLLVAMVLVTIQACHYRESWQTITRKDLDEIHSQITKNHPGMVNPEDPQFAQRMNACYQEALQKAHQVDSKAAYQALLKWFTNSFQDKHIGITFKNPIKTIYWPGFIVSYKNNNFVVSYIHESWSRKLPAIGDKLLLCDQMDPIDYINNYVLPYNQGIPGIEADYVRFSSECFVDDGNPWFKRPSRCTFKHYNQTTAYPLSWQEISRADYNKIVDAIFKKPIREIMFEELPDDGVWISIPTLWPTGNEIAHMNKVIEQAHQMHDEKYIVLDMRGCNGGDATWGIKLVSAIYGDRYISFITSKSPRVFQDWYVTPDNFERIKWLVEFEKRQMGKSGEYLLEIKKLMEQALKHKEKFVHWVSPNTESPQQECVKPHTYAKVFFLTDYSCVSGCLIFADIALTIPGVIQVGVPTDADTIYMPITEKILPSGAEFIMPIAIQRNRERKPNKPYIPEKSNRFEGDINDTQALKKWIVEKILPKN